MFLRDDGLQLIAGDRRRALYGMVLIMMQWGGSSGGGGRHHSNGEAYFLLSLMIETHRVMSRCLDSCNDDICHKNTCSFYGEPLKKTPNTHARINGSCQAEQ
jgi:hypothetical protein